MDLRENFPYLNTSQDKDPKMNTKQDKDPKMNTKIWTHLLCFLLHQWLHQQQYSLITITNDVFPCADGQWLIKRFKSDWTATIMRQLYHSDYL